MEYETILIFLNLMATVYTQAPQYQELIQINQLNDFFGFDHNIFLLDVSTDHSRYIATSTNCGVKYCNYTPQSVYIFNSSPNKNITKMETFDEITSKNTFLIVVAGSSEFESNLNLLDQVKKIRDLNVDMKIGVFYAQSLASTDIIEKLFQWSWNNRILNIFAAFYLDGEDEMERLLNVFKFNPYGTFNLINVTQSQSFQNYFPDKILNFHKHPIRFASVKNLPMYKYDVILWELVRDKLNASASMIGVDQSWVVSQVIHDVYDIMPYNTPMKNKIKLYPVGMETMVLMVPYSLPYTDFVTYLKSATPRHLFGYSFVIVLVTLTLTISGYMKTKKFSFFQYVVDVVNLLMNDNGTIRYQQLSRAEVCVVVPLTFAGLLTVYSLLSSFQSYVTSPIYRNQINTIEDLYKSPFPILVDDVHWENEIPTISDNLSPGGWSDKVHPTGYLQLISEIKSFNRSISFSMPYNQAQVLLAVQKKLNLKVYHIIPGTYYELIVSYVINDNFPFAERINHIFHCLQNAGLVNKWHKDFYQFWFNKIVDKNRKYDSTESKTVITVFTDHLIWVWIATAVVFICEIIWSKYTSR